MSGIVERIGSLAGTELAKAINLAHSFYNERMGLHGHTGRALVETVAEVARNHPNLVGIGVGLLVEQLLAEEKRRHDAYLAGVDPQNPDADIEIARAKAKKSPEPEAESHPSPSHHSLTPTHRLRLSTQTPGRVALEVFGALLLLKFASSGARMFRRKGHGEVWFAPAARIRLFSGTLAAYYLAKSIRSPKLSAWRNAAIALFGTDALKPVLKGPKRKKGQVRAVPPVALAAPDLALSAPPPPDPVQEPLHESLAAPAHHNIDPSTVSTLGIPKRDPRPMPVWPSEAKKAATPAPEPVLVAAPEPVRVEPPLAPAPPPVEAHEGPFPPG